MGRARGNGFIAIMVLLSMFMPVFTGIALAEGDVGIEQLTRLAGLDRYETAALIALEANDQADTVIIARGDDDYIMDSLAGSVLAGALDAPILLTTHNQLHAKTLETIVNLGAKNVVLLGGVGAISPAVFAELEDAGLIVKRVAGKDRYETAAEIARLVSTELGAAFGNKAFVVSAGPDALVIGPFAVANGIPILMVRKDSVPEATTKVIDELNITEVTVIGGTGVVSDAVINSLGANRVYGANRYETSFKVANNFYDAPPEQVLFASGQDGNLVDAVAGSYLGAKLNAPILYSYSGNLHKDVSGYFRSIVSENTSALILGGKGALSQGMEDEVYDLVTSPGLLQSGNLLLGELPAGNTLGRGYDVFDLYADPAAIKAKVLDYGALHAAGLVEEFKLEKATYTTISGKTHQEYSQNISKKVSLEGDYQFFSSSFSASFSESYYSSSEYEFATVQARVNKTGVAIDGRQDAEKLSDYLTQEFKQDLNNKDYPVTELFKKYGTHVMTGVILGARLDYNYSANTSNASSSASIAAAARASYAGTFSVDSSFEYSKDSSSSQGYTNVDYTTGVVGGASELAYAIHLEGKYEQWMNSVAANAVLCDFYPDGLMPIWKLAENSARADKISEDFTTWAKARQVGYEFQTGIFKLNHEAVGFTRHTGQGDKDIYTQNGRQTFVDLLIEMRLDGNKLVVEIVNLTVEEGQYKNAMFSGGVTKTFPLPVPANGTVTMLGGQTEFKFSRIVIMNKRHDWVSLGNGILVRIDGMGDSGPYIGVKFFDLRVPFTYSVKN